MKILKTAKTGYIASSAVLCAVGLLIIINPGISLKAVCYAAGALLIICGAFKIIGYFSNDLYSLAFQHDRWSTVRRYGSNSALKPGKNYFDNSFFNWINNTLRRPDKNTDGS